MAIVDIINDALARASCPRITSLAESSESAAFASAIYVNIIKEVIAKGPWSSRIKRATLVQSTTPEYEFTYSYSIPSNFLKLLQFQTDDPLNYKYRIENIGGVQKILTDEPSLKITYLEYSADPDAWDIFLQEAIITRLAAQFASNVGNYNLRQALMAEFRLAVLDGLANNNQQQSGMQLYVNHMANIRESD